MLTFSPPKYPRNPSRMYEYSYGKELRNMAEVRIEKLVITDFLDAAHLPLVSIYEPRLGLGISTCIYH